MNNHAIGARVQVIRNAAGLTQQQLADLTGWNERLVARIESGGRPLRYSEAITLARALAVPVGAFAGDDAAGPSQDVLAAENRRLRARHARMTARIRRALDESDTDG